MSYYEKRYVLAKTNNPETSKRWDNVLRMLKEKNNDMASVEDILAAAEKNNGAMEFEFEYYSDEAFREYENLLKEAESSDNEDGVVVKLDSDFGSYFSVYGKVDSEEFDPQEEQWITGTFASVIINIKSERLSDWLECEADEVEDLLVDNQEELVDFFGISEYEDIELEVESYEEEDERSIFQLGLGLDFFRFGTIDDLKNNFEAIKRLNDIVVSMEGYMTLGQPDIVLLNDKGECDWISEKGFKELILKSKVNELGVFVATNYVLR